MEKRKNIVSVGERGSITIFVLVAVIFFLAIAFTAYAGSISKTQTQEKEFEKIKMNYQNSYNDEQIRELYNDVVYGDKTVLEYAIGAKPTTTATIIEADETKGIVMVDDTGNEWVWVEVPKEVFATATSNTSYDAIKADLIEYAGIYRNGSSSQTFSWIDEWYALDGETVVTASTEGLTDTQKALNNGCGLTYDEYNTAYETMLSSVYDNKGFYISRYEIGDKESTINNTTRTSSTGVANTPVSKVDQIPYNYVTCSDAQILASSMATGDNKTSSLLFGLQWDLVCKYLEVNGNWDTTTNTASYYIKTNSTSWGNYKDSSLTLKSGKYNISPSSSTSLWTAFNIDMTNYVTASQTSSDTNYYQSLTTGASDGTNKMNIYDFAGNEYEWTLEKTIGTSYQCVCRGGNYGDTGSYSPVAYRSGGNTIPTYYHISFRSSLY